MPAHRADGLQVFGGMPEIEKLYGGRFRLTFRCDTPDNTEGWYYDNKDNLLTDFGTLMDAGFGHSPETPDPDSTWPNQRLVDHGLEYLQGKETPIVKFVYETLTDGWAKEDEDKPSSTENGLRTLTRVQVARPDHIYTAVLDPAGNDNAIALEGDFDTAEIVIDDSSDRTQLTAVNSDGDVTLTSGDKRVMVVQYSDESQQASGTYILYPNAISSGWISDDNEALLYLEDEWTFDIAGIIPGYITYISGTGVGFPDDASETGGWSTPNVTITVTAHPSTAEKAIEALNDLPGLTAENAPSNDGSGYVAAVGPIDATLIKERPYDEDDVGVETITDAGKTLYLAGFQDDSDDRRGRFITRWAEAGILSVRTPKVGGQQQVVVSALGMTEAAVTAALSEVTANHKLIDVSKSNYAGFQTLEYTFEVDDFMVIIAADNDLTAIRRIRLSATNITRGTINDSAITVDAKTFVLRQEEVDNDGIIKKAVGVYVAYEAASFPATTLYEIDRRYGIAIPIERQVVASSESGVINSTQSVQLEPVDSFRSVKFTALAADVPAQQIWYERRNVNLFPPVLDSVSVVGSETYALFPNYIEAPVTPLKVRMTRTFTWGAPPEATGTNERVFRPQPFAAGVEVSVTSQSQSVNTSNGTSTSNTTSQNTGSSTSQTTSENTGTSTSQTTSSNQGSSTSQTTSNNTGNSTSQTTSNNTGNSTSNTTSNNSGNSTSNTTSNNTGNSTSNTNSNSTSFNSSATNTGVDGRQTAAVGRAVFISDVTRNTQSFSNTTSDGNSTSQVTGSSTSQTTNQNTGSSTSQTTSQNTGNSTSQTTSQNSGNSTSQTTSSNQGSSTSDTTSNNSGSSTSNTTSNNSGSSTSQTTSQNTGTSTSSTNGSSTTSSQSTGKRIIPLNLRACLRSATTVVVQGNAINIPATVPTNLPWGEYTEISRQASHWKHNVWVEEVAEALLPAAP